MKITEASSLQEYLYLHYMVVLHEGEDPYEVSNEYADTGVEITNVYDSAINGFSAHLYDFTIEEMQQDDRIKLIEEDGEVEEDEIHQFGSHWGLDRISGGVNSQYSYKNDGYGSTIYIIDSGIRADHVEFEDIELVLGYIEDPNDPWGSGHGTAVASFAVGKLCGVAKQARVFDIATHTLVSSRISGIEWVIENGTPPYPVNISFSVTTVNETFDTAVQNLLNAGFTVVNSAGNDTERDMSTTSPQKIADVVVVSGTNVIDSVGLNTSEGPETTILAPSDHVLGADVGSPTGYRNRATGTSYGAPLVSGAIALILAEDPTLNRQQVIDRLLALAEYDAITGLRKAETPNILLNIDGIGGSVYSYEDATTSIQVEEAQVPPGEAQFSVVDSTTANWQGEIIVQGQFGLLETSLANWQASVVSQSQFELLDGSLAEWQAVVGRAGEFSALDSSAALWQALVDHAGEFSASDTSVADWFGGVSGATQFVVFDRTSALWSGATEAAGNFAVEETSTVEWVPLTESTGSFSVSETSTVSWSVAVESGGSFGLVDTSTATWDSYVVGTAHYSVIESSVVGWHGYVEAVAEATFNVTDKTTASFRASSLVWRNIDLSIGDIKLDFSVGTIDKSYVPPSAPLVLLGIGKPDINISIGIPFV